jgi:uncharacterized protein YqgC (DUF456 family)
MKRRRSIVKLVVVSAVFAAVFIPVVAAAVWQVLHGRGAAVYTNVYGLAIHYTSLLIMVAALILALGVAYIARLVYFRRYGNGEVTELRELQPRTPYTDPGDRK